MMKIAFPILWIVLFAILSNSYRPILLIILCLYILLIRRNYKLHLPKYYFFYCSYLLLWRTARYC
ncbi:hypothetical protein BSAE_1864 [Bifidobacterium pullorum subsp. saeculare DSM 6531 = LMG 14934]|uniref:Uncharacterized protein n=1 Tax=Bifidobacterium pullorum subsp. saeculare DSM 6531 = LMG 14934 TaxID=1437611 RepID=A0A087CPG2_9BIFI|nr:hypothetical protein BSAE_1864 [Bifidobacterium pullorum subsp. saeculare DSM 6531 = LMG 14934]